MYIVTEVAPYADGPAGVHGVLGQATAAFGELAGLAGLEPVPVTRVADLSPDQLTRGGVLVLFTIGETPWSAEQRRAVEEAWRAGRLPVLGVHSATDASHGWPAYGEILGGRFDGHPWTQPFEIEVVDRSHPATAHLGPSWAWQDEVYLFKDLRPDARVLLSLAEGQLDMSVNEARTPACGFPLAWCHTEGLGRTFYSALGHFPLAWETPGHLRYLAGGLSWLLEGGDATA
jgi:type 1 glutamine amidotransferase